MSIATFRRIGFCLICWVGICPPAMGIQFPVSATYDFTLDLGFGDFPFSAAVDSAGLADALADVNGVNAEIRQMQMDGTGSLFGLSVPVSTVIGRDLGLPASTGSFDGGSAAFDVYFETEVITNEGVILAYNQAPLQLAATFNPPAAIPFPEGAIYRSTAPVDIYDANSGDLFIGTMDDFTFALVADQDIPSVPVTIGPNGEFIFQAAVSGLWFDPPYAIGFDYAMTGGSRFTEIMDFPEGFGDNFEIVVGGNSVGVFGPGQPVDFVSLVGDAVSEFRLIGITPPVDAADPLAFPLQLAFDTPTADFMMTAIPVSPDCDFSGDGVCDTTDLDMLQAVGPISGPGVPATGSAAPFDLDGNGVVDIADRDQWLADAALANSLSSAYKLGDANLDGTVDGQDFIAWNATKFSSSLLWSEGNFTGDAFVDGQDFLAWNTNKFTSSDGINRVPELETRVYALLGIALLAWAGRSR